MLTIYFEMKISNDVSDDDYATTETCVREVVPEGLDPRAFLRDRILKEFGITLAPVATDAPVPTAPANPSVNA